MFVNNTKKKQQGLKQLHFLVYLSFQVTGIEGFWGLKGLILGKAENQPFTKTGKQPTIQS